MIVFNLFCENEHLFEGWFASAKAFEAQVELGQLNCPVCGSDRIVRRPSAPYVNVGATQAPAATTQPGTTSAPTSANSALAPAHATAYGDVSAPSPETLAKLVAVLRNAAKLSEDVGERFPEEARRIHYGESEARSIKGKASRDDIGELLEEGIMILPVPPAEEDLH